MEDIKEQGIFIPFDIWTIKNLNINEKLVLSDIYNKELHSGKTEYNTKAETLENILLLDIFTINNIFNTLQKKRYIKSNPERFTDRKGRFKTGISRRYINYENFKNAERFIIPENNIFLRNGEKGVFFNDHDLYFLNAWSRTTENLDNEKIKLRAKTTNKHLIMILIIRKISFFHEKSECFFARFSIKDLVEFTGITRQTISLYIKILTSLDSYKQKRIRFLYKLSAKERYKELVHKFGDVYILQDFRKINNAVEFETESGHIDILYTGDLENLYYINLNDMDTVGINVVNLTNNKK